jgi:hypothetical protein
MRADGSSFPPSLHFFSPFHYETGGESLLVHFPGFKDKRAGPISIIRKKRGTRKKQKEIKKNERKKGKKGKKRRGSKKGT